MLLVSEHSTNVILYIFFVDYLSKTMVMNGR